MNKKSIILHAAENLFILQGYQNITMHMISEEAAIPKGSIQLYWKGKDQILDALIENAIAKDIKIIKNISEDKTLNEITRMHNIFRACLVKPDGLKLRLLEESNRPGNEIMRIKLNAAQTKAITPFISNIIIEGNEKKIFNNPFPNETTHIMLSCTFSLFNKSTFEWSLNQIEKFGKAYAWMIAKLADTEKDSFEFIGNLLIDFYNH